MKSAKEFKERIKTDPEFKDKFKGIQDVNEAIRIAKENGYDLKNCSPQEEQELTEDMLENVAGGKNTTKTQVKTHIPSNVVVVTDPNDPEKKTIIPI